MERSPETKRKRAETYDSNSSVKLSSAPAATHANDDATLLEPLPATDNPDLYERTNHVQRFRRTRALFAQMEKQNMTSSGATFNRGRVASRSVSPGRNRSSAHYSPATSPRPYVYDVTARRHSPAASPRARLPSDSSPSAHAFDYSHTSTSSYARSPATSPRNDVDSRAGSVSPSYVNTATFRPYAPPYRKSDPKSRSESDLLHTSDVSEPPPPPQTSPPSAVQDSTPATRTSASVTSSLVPPWMQQRNASVTSSAKLNRNNSSSDVTPPPSVDAPVTSAERAEVTSSSYKYAQSYTRPSVRAGAPENAVEAHKKAREYIPKFKEDHDDDAEAIRRMDSIFSWRSRRSREKQQSQQSDEVPAPAPEVVTSAASGSRLSRRTPKQDLSSSLESAEAYWKSETQTQNGDVTSTSHLLGRLNDSVASSGSGEEMARSESHEHIVLPDQSPSSPPPHTNSSNAFLQNSALLTERDASSSWTSKYAIPSATTTTASQPDPPSSTQDSSPPNADDVITSGALHKTDTFERELSKQQHDVSTSDRHRSSSDDAAEDDDVMDDEDDVGMTHLDPEKDIDFEVPISSPSTASKPPPPFPESAKPL